MQDSRALCTLQEELTHHGALPYGELVARIGQPPLSMQMICGNERYFAQIKVLWHDRRAGEVCLSGSIHDGGWRALVPETESRIIAPTGEVRAPAGGFSGPNAWPVP
jgi:hypothetical protein